MLIVQRHRMDISSSEKAATKHFIHKHMKDCTIATKYRTGIRLRIIHQYLHATLIPLPYMRPRIRTTPIYVFGSTIFLYAFVVCNMHALKTSCLVRVEHCVRTIGLLVNHHLVKQLGIFFSENFDL